MARRPSAIRLSEFRLSATEGRMSRADQGRSLIPKPQGYSSSLDRISGVCPFGNEQSYRTSSRRLSRSAESCRSSIGRYKYRNESAQRNSSVQRSRMMGAPYRDTYLMDSTIKDYQQTPMSCRKNSIRTPSNEKIKTLRAILRQALSTDPIKDERQTGSQSWQKDTASRVLSKLRKLNFPLPGAQPLKPIALQLFFDICNYLLGKFGGPRLHINSGNYQEKLPVVTRKLKYPGMTNKSWLKCVNVAFAYPHLLALFSYLLELSDFKDIIEDNIRPSELFGVDDVLTIKRNYYIAAWKIYNDNCDDYESIDQEYINGLYKLYKLSEELFEEQEAELQELKDEKKEKALALENAKMNEKVVFEKMKSMKEMFQQVNKQHATVLCNIANVSSKYEKEKATLEVLKNTSSELQCVMKKLKESLSMQKMNKHEKSEFMNKIRTSEEIINSKKKFINNMQQNNFNRDLTLSNIQKKALEMCTDVNSNIFSVGISTGQRIDNFSITARELLNPDTRDIIDKNITVLRDLVKQAEVKLYQISDQKQQCEVNHNRIKEKIEILKKEEEILLSNQEHISTIIEEKKLRSRAMNEKHEEIIMKHGDALVSLEDSKQVLQEALAKLEDSKRNENEWKIKLDKIRSEESSVHEHCKKRAEMLIKEYILYAKNVVNVAKNIKNK